MPKDISKVELVVGTAENITVNSLKLIVASDANFSNVIATINGTFKASSTITFTPSSGSWATGAYYKFVFSLTAASSSKAKYVEFSSAKFYYDDTPAEETAVSTPTFDPTDATITDGQEITLTCGTEGASMYYNWGTELTSANYSSAGTLYSAEAKPTASASNTLYVYAVKEGLDAASASKAYTVLVSTPTISPNGGSVNTGKEITLSSATTGASIYYSWGTELTSANYESGELYSDANKPTATASGTLYVYAAKAGLTGAAASAAFTVESVDEDHIYQKVTSDSELGEGNYLIVYETGSVAFNGGLETLDGISNTISVDITTADGKKTIPVKTVTTAASFDLTVSGSTYYIKSTSGYYIGRDATSNGMNSSTTTSYPNTISIDGSGNATITATSKTTATYLRYNKASDQLRFRYFTGNQQSIQLYKKIAVGKKESGFAFPQATYNVIFGNAFSDDHALTKAEGYDGTITYSSSKPEVATVTNDGTVTILAIGTTTITATGAESDTFLGGTASYTLNVVDKLDPEVTLSSSSLDVITGAEPAAITVSTATGYDGTLDVATDNDAVATAAYSEGTITVTFVGIGTTDIHLAAAATSTYAAVDKVISVTVNDVPKIDLTGLKALTFSISDNSDLSGTYADNNSKTNLKGKYADDEAATNFTGFTIYQVSKQTGFQFQAKNGKLTFPKVVSLCGFTVTYELTSGKTVTPIVTIDGTTTSTTLAEEAVLVISGASSGAANLTSITLTPKQPVAPSDVTFSPASGAEGVIEGTKIVLSSADATKIYYTTDGTEPTIETTTFIDGESGSITATEVGTLTIKAIGWNKFGTSAVSTATYTVSAAPLYVRVNSTDELVAGQKYLLVYEKDATEGNVFTTINSSNIGLYESVTISHASLKLGVTSDANILTLGGSEGEWSFQTNDNNYLSWSSGNSLETNADDASDNQKWTITIDENFVMSIKNNADDRYLACNPSSSRYACYTAYNATNKNPILYRPVADAEALSLNFRLDGVKLEDNTYAATTYCITDKAYRVPSGVTGYTVSAAPAGGGLLTLAASYKPGMVVPQGEALLLIAGETGLYNTYSTETEAEKVASNLLFGATTMPATTEDGYRYYKLTTSGGTNPGFYWGADDGGRFDMNNTTTCYLKVSAEVVGEARSLTFGSMLTGLNPTPAVRNAASAEGTAYDLQGRRVQVAGKGLYIVNGKKVLVK